MKTKWLVVRLIGLVLLLAGFATQGSAEVNVNVGVFAPPPPYVFAAPPPVVVIPGSYVYMVPDAQVSILFYRGHWWRHHDGHWFRGKAYNGPWGYIKHDRVPRGIIAVPPDYYHHRRPLVHDRIPYGHYNKNWKRWEREKHWDRDDRWREGRHDKGRGDKRDKHRDDKRGKHRDDDRDRQRDDGHRGDRGDGHRGGR
jgi:hypothetical protein